MEMLYRLSYVGAMLMLPGGQHGPKNPRSYGALHQKYDATLLGVWAREDTNSRRDFPREKSSGLNASAVI